MENQQVLSEPNNSQNKDSEINFISRVIKRKFPVFYRLLKYLRPYYRQFFLGLFAMSVFGATDGIIPYLLKRILDDVFGSHNEQMLYVLIGAIMGFAVLRGCFGFLQKYLSATVGLNIVRDIRNEIYYKFLTLSSSFYVSNSTGNLISRVTNDTLLVKSALTDAVVSLLRDTVRIVALAITAFVLDPVLAAIAVFGLPLGLFPVLKFGKKVRKLSRVGQDRLGGLTSVLHETITGHNVIQAFTKESHQDQKFRAENEKFTETYRRAEKYGALSAPTNEILGSCLVAGVIFYGGVSVISGVRTEGQFIAFITTMFLLYEPLKKLSNVNNTLQAGTVAAERIFEVLDSMPEVQDKVGAVELDSQNPSIEFRNVWFRYRRAAAVDSSRERDSQTVNQGGATPSVENWALQGVSLKVLGGQTAALVGRSGSGKSTLLRLLPRFFDPTSGQILIDGRDITDYTLESLRRSISIVHQHTFLFNDTIFNNIAFGAEQPTLEQVVAAAKAANAHSFISQLPDGYQTQVGEQGFALSGGERARLSIARALLKDSPILVLDEATANLDSQSEELVRDAIERLMKGKTVLVIAHRLSTIRSADQIAVMKSGKLCELGSHQELLELGKEYFDLYRLQFRQNEDSSSGDERVANV